VHRINVVEGLQTIVVLYGACGTSSAPCGGVHHILSPLAIIAVYHGKVTENLWTTETLADHCCALRCTTVHYGVLQKRCGSPADHWNASKPLRFTTTHCGASSARCGGVHHTRNSLTIVAVIYGNITESLGTTGTLANHCDALRYIAVHCSANSTRCGGVHHTLTETRKFHPLPHHPTSPQKLTANS